MHHHGLECHARRLVCCLQVQGHSEGSYNHIWLFLPYLLIATPQLGAADAEIRVSSGENTELKHSPFKGWSRSVYRHICYDYCQGFLPCLFLPFRSIHLHFFQNLSRFLLCWLWLTHGSCIGPQNKIGHPAGCRFPCWVPTEYKKANTKTKNAWLVVWGLVKWMTWGWGGVCVRPWCDPLWLTGLKTPTS